MPAAEGASPARRPTRYRRRLRSRIILSFLLLGFGLTLLLAFATNWARNRVENQLVEDVMNKNIDEFARRYYTDPARIPTCRSQQMLGGWCNRRIRGAARRAARSGTTPDGIHGISGTNPTAVRSRTSSPCARRPRHGSSSPTT
jgi:hypothetical protein